MLKHVLVLMLLLLVSAMVSVSVCAAPSYYGFSGLIFIPTADCLDRGDYNFSVNMMDVSGEGNFSAYNAVYGMSDNFEVGISSENWDYSAEPYIEGKTKYVYINAKYRIRSEVNQEPAIAVGVIDITDDYDPCVYVVGSRSLNRNANSPVLHLGFGTGFDLDGIFGGISAPVGDRFTVEAEYDTYEYNFGARYQATPELGVHVFLVDGDELGAGVNFCHKN